MSDDKSKDEHQRREYRHKAKFTDDTPAEVAEKKEISSRVGRGLLTDKEALYGAPTAPSGTYVGEVIDAAGNVIRFIGAKVPLYITHDILDFEFVEFLKKHPDNMADVVSRGTMPTDEDKIVIMAGHLDGRTTLQGYQDPTELFATDSGAKPMLVKDYFLEPSGLSSIKERGVRDSIKHKIGSRLTLTNRTLAQALGNAVRGVAIP